MRVFVIGAGAAGMGASILLARYGHQVTLCEAGARVGPLLRGFKRRGRHFDTGLHCVGSLGAGQTLWRYLHMLGLLPHLAFRPMRGDSVELFRFADGDISLPGGLDAAAEKLGEIWPEHAAGVRSFMERLREKFFHSPFTNPYSKNFDFIRQEAGEGALALLESFVFPERLKSLLMAHIVFMGTDPREVALADYALVSHSMREGMHVISGGGAALVAAFERELAARGVVLLTGLAAEKINLQDGMASSVTLADGRAVPCDAVVYSGHPRLLTVLLPEGALRPSMALHLNEIRDTEPCISIYGLSASSFADGRFVYLCGSDDISDVFNSPESARIWLTVSAGEAGPDGRRPVIINLSLPGGLRAAMGDVPAAVPGAKERPEGYAARKAEYVDRALRQLRERCPELSDFELVDSSTDYSMREWVYGSTGSVYGVVHSLGQIPVLPRTKVPNLVLAGQGVILPGLLGALVSGAVAAGMLAGFDKVFEEFRNAGA